MTRPHVACVCVDQGIWAALTVYGPTADQLVAAFREDHSGPGHIPEVPPRDWYGRHAAFLRHLAELQRGATSTG
jgi:hypothetical protein